MLVPSAANGYAFSLATELGFAPPRGLLRMSSGEPLRAKRKFIHAIAGLSLADLSVSVPR